MSSLSTSSALNRTLDTSDDHGMDIDAPAGRSERSREKARAVELEQPRYIQGPNGILIIEEIETPATRREKQRRNKAKRLQQLENDDLRSSVSVSAVPDDDDGDLSSVLTPPPESETEDTHADTDKSLASIGDIERDIQAESATHPTPSLEPKQAAPVNSIVIKKPRAPRMVDRGFFQLAKRGRIPEGTIGGSSSFINSFDSLTPQAIVWAKQGNFILNQTYIKTAIDLDITEGFPWWPGVVYADNSEHVPRKIKNNRDKDINSKIKPGGPFHFINFYDKQRTWSWFQAEKLKMFNVDLGKRSRLK